MRKKTTRVRRNFTPEFKRDAVRLLRGGRRVTDVADSLGVARSLLQRWREQIEASSDEAGFSIVHTSELNSTMRWTDLSEVWIVVTGDEAWWSLRSDQNTMIVPTYLIAGGDEFRERICALPGFDEAAFIAAKQAESSGKRDGDELHCWSKPVI